MYDLRAFMFFCLNLIISSVRAIRQMSPKIVRHTKSIKLGEYLGPSSNKNSNDKPKLEYSIE